jgi:Anthrone oxygenase
MLTVLQVVTLVLVAIAMALALAHALELPGKLRLSKDEYLAVQPIYYPGFTIGGAAEPAGLLLILALMLLTPRETPLWLTAGAFAALAAMHAVYWLLTHPVNNFWLKDVERKGLGRSFFAVDPLQGSGDAPADWTKLRDRWEFSHVVRAVLGLASLILLATAVAA